MRLRLISDRIRDRRLPRALLAPSGAVLWPQCASMLDSVALRRSGATSTVRSYHAVERSRSSHLCMLALMRPPVSVTDAQVFALLA